MKNFIKSHLPENKAKWKDFFFLFFPMLVGSTTYAFNGFVDNFMVGQIEQGTTALAAINSWTAIIMGIYIGLSSTASFIMARYFYSNQLNKATELFKFRILVSVSIGFIFALIAWTNPDIMIKVFLKKPKNNILKNINAYNLAVENSRIYLKIIAIQWILISITLNFANSLRESGHPKGPMYWGIVSLIVNITLNSILMYVFKFGVDGAAWASVAARIFAFSIGIYWIISKKVGWGFWPWQIFKIKKDVIKDFFSKFYLFFSITFAFIFITIRNVFYDAAYPVGTNTLGVGVSAMSILGLTGAIMNIFTTTFSISSSMSAAIVSKFLSRGQTKEALMEAKRLKGFMFLTSTSLSILMFITAIFVPKFLFLSQVKYEEEKLTFDNIQNLKQVRDSLFIVCFYYPIWIWFSSSYRSGCSGKKGFWFAFVDLIITGPIQLSWLAILSYLIIPTSPIMQKNFYIFYFLFFLSDFIKLISIEFLFYKYKWNSSIKKIKKKRMKTKIQNKIVTSRINK